MKIELSEEEIDTVLATFATRMAEQFRQAVEFAQFQAWAKEGFRNAESRLQTVEDNMARALKTASPRGFRSTLPYKNKP